jgi:hypothetical protein
MLAGSVLFAALLVASSAKAADEAAKKDASVTFKITGMT